MEKRPTKKPYIIRGVRDWIVDCGMTPYILVNCEHPDVVVPAAYVDENSRIILNISEQSTIEYMETNDVLEFGAKFKSLPHRIVIPTEAIIGIYSKETGEGIVFDFNVGSTFSDRKGIDSMNEKALNREEPKPETPPRPKKGKPHLTLVKNDNS